MWASSMYLLVLNVTGAVLQVSYSLDVFLDLSSDLLPTQGTLRCQDVSHVCPAHFCHYTLSWHGKCIRIQLNKSESA